MANVTVVNSVETLAAKLVEMREAQAKFATFTQAQVDEICKQAAMAADKARIPLAKMAHYETVIAENKAAGTKRIAEPVGIVGAVTPTTNPTSTVIYKILLCLKTRNAILLSPHPTAKKCSIEAARIMKEAAEKNGKNYKQ